MVVVVKAQLLQPVVFVGERIRCSLTIRNNDSVIAEEFAWGSAQLYCHCVYSQTKVKMLHGVLPRPAPTSSEYAFSPSKGKGARMGHMRAEEQ